ncbi:50S ribosomal protein L9 [Candidatus Wolfebacteria bacterium]|nr:50S ribosomal protein L9 [Candidatus Wolfebacteria bacterium]
MKVILLQDIAKVGRKHEVKEVARGHALNFLIPRGMAEAATPAALRTLENRKAQKEETAALSDKALADALAQLDGKTIILAEKANEQGHLFAAIHTKEIAQALATQKGLTIDVANIQLEHPIKEVGEYEVALISGDAKAKLLLHIKPIQK